MRSILKKIALRKIYKKNISMEAGFDPTNIRMAAYLLVNSANIIYGCLHTRIETALHYAVYLHSVIGWQRRTLDSMVELALGRGATTHCVGIHCRIQRMLAPLLAGVLLQRTHRE